MFLYADDVFFLRELVSSMMVLNDILDKYGMIFEYKINQGKLIMLGFHISHLIRDHIHDRGNGIWCQGTVTYLGITSTDNLNYFIES